MNEDMTLGDFTPHTGIRARPPGVFSFGAGAVELAKKLQSKLSFDPPRKEAPTVSG